MTAPDLLAYCAARGIRLAAKGDRLRCFPRDALTPDLLASLRHHKPALLALLATPAPPAWQEPSARDLAAAQAALDAFYPPPPKAPTAGACRCGCMTWTDVAIHGGASLRRDCADCGRFRAFVRWHGRRFDN